MAEKLVLVCSDPSVNPGDLQTACPSAHWVSESDLYPPSFAAGMSTQDVADIASAILVLFCVAFIAKFLRRMITNR